MRKVRIRSVGCVYADRCVYAPDAAFTHMCLYAVVLDCWWVRLAVYAGRCVYAGRGAYTQWVHICTRVCIRGSVRIRERWVRTYAAGVHVYVNAPGCDVCIRGSVRLRERWVCIHRFLRIRTPDRRAYTQESTNRNARSTCV